MSSPEARDEHVVDALLDAGALLADPIRMGSLLDELRAHRPEPSPELRGRVADALALPAGAPRRRSRPTRRFALAGALAATAVVIALGAGSLLHDGGSTTEVALRDVAAPATSTRSGGVAGAGIAPSMSQRAAAPTAASPATVPAPSATRLQDYQASIELRVRGTRRLSQVTQRTISLTRGFGGYVILSNVDLRGVRSGSAQVNVRIPIARVQDALARFSSLGTIVGQHVAVADLQNGFDATGRRIEALRHSLALIEIRLADPKLTPERHVALLAQRERAQHALAGARETSKTLAARGAYARLDLSFATGATVAPVVPESTGRLEHALRRAGGILETVAIGGIYVLVLGAPVLLVGLLVLAASRTRRRRGERALLDGI